MSRFLRSFALVAIVGAVWFAQPASAAAPNLDNAGFETGDTSGWNEVLSAGSISVNESEDAFGSFNVQLSAGSSSSGSPVTLSQEFNASVGQTIAGLANFVYTDIGGPFCDYGRVVIVDDDDNVVATPFDADGCSTGSTGWQEWEYEFNTSGTFTIRVETANTTDTLIGPFLLFDISEDEPSRSGAMARRINRGGFLGSSPNPNNNNNAPRVVTAPVEATPSAPVGTLRPPSTGDGGLASSSSSREFYSITIAVAFALAGLARLKLVSRR